MSKPLRCPFITTVYPISDRADVKLTIRKIQDKIMTYGIISEKEQAYLDKYGQKELVKS